MSLALALYKGPAEGLFHKIGHWAVCVFTRSKYSHVELVVDGQWCYSSSSRDHGVRCKVIDLASGRWDVVPIEGNELQAAGWYSMHYGEKYDWAGVLRFAFKFLPRRQDEWFCSEAVAAMLGLDTPDQYTPQSLLDRMTHG